MEHNHTQFAALTAPMHPATTVTFLRCKDLVVLDRDPVFEILATRGALTGEAIICRALEDIALRLDTLQDAVRAHGFEAVEKPAKRIQHVGAQLGLTDVIRSAAHVATAARQSDGVALSATMARLERAFDVAIAEVWRFRDER